MSWESWNRARARDDDYDNAELLRTRAMQERPGQPGKLPKAGPTGSKVAEAVKRMPGGLPGGFIGDGNDDQSGG